MHNLVLFFTTIALLCGSHCASVKHKLLSEIDNSIQPNVTPSKNNRERKFVTITKRPAAINHHQSGTITELTCEAIGLPAPSIRWFRNDTPVYEHNIPKEKRVANKPLSLVRVTSTLLVTRATGHDDYTCLAAAGLKTVAATATVISTDGSSDVSERSKLLPLKPRIVLSHKVHIEDMGNNIVLPCHVKGHPRPKVTWRDNRGAVVKADPRMKVLRSGELVISALRWSDMGEFTCRATNAFGSDEAATFVYPSKAG